MLRLNFLILSLIGNLALAESLSLKQSCLKYLNSFPSYFKEEVIDSVCEKVQQSEGCQSQNKEPIFHSDFKGVHTEGKKILVISLIHGDETHAGHVGRYWMERLEKIQPRNSWRVIPIANPDGVNKKTRTNANGVDLNRNFPTLDWSTDAIKYWEKHTQKNARRFPGYAAGGEVETQCIIKHLEDYKPDFVISVHTPLNVLDFDGPDVKNKVKYSYLPWRSLGNFPGSLGRYLWVERQTPVLTAELKSKLPSSALPFEQLQDLIGTLVKKDLK